MEGRWEGRRKEKKVRKKKTSIVLLIDCKLHENKDNSYLVAPEPKATKAVSIVPDVLLVFNKYYRWLSGWMNGWMDI